MRYVQGIQPNIPERTTFIDINNFSKSLLLSRNLRLGLSGGCTFERTNVPGSSEHSRTLFHHPQYVLTKFLVGLLLQLFL